MFSLRKAFLLVVLLLVLLTGLVGWSVEVFITPVSSPSSHLVGDYCPVPLFAC